MTTYRHTEDMGEISGFGGGYETCCQDMLEAGMKWLSKHPKAILEGRVFQNIYGLLKADSPDAKQLEAVVLRAANGEATGAMHHAVMSRLFWISENGWDAYCSELMSRKVEKEQG